jgi:hypothetical protein
VPIPGILNSSNGGGGLIEKNPKRYRRAYGCYWIFK